MLLFWISLWQCGFDYSVIRTIFFEMFFLIGIIGEYIAILFTELKDRPVYIVDETRNFEEGEQLSK